MCHGACRLRHLASARATGIRARTVDQRVAELEHAQAWQLDGRAAAALGQQGWQASLDWRQNGPVSDLHLAGPLGVGAIAITVAPAGISLNGAPPTPRSRRSCRSGWLRVAARQPQVLAARHPDPDVPFDLTRNAQDRAQHLAQAGWSIDYDQYRPAGGDALPAHLVLSRADARVRIVVDRWLMPL